VYNVRDDDIGELDDHMYEISTRNREQRETFEFQFKEDEQEEVSVRSTTPQLDDDEIENERMQEIKIEIKNDEVTDDEADDYYSENNYYSRGSIYVEYDKDKATEDSDEGNIRPVWDTNYENTFVDVESKFKDAEEFRLCLRQFNIQHNFNYVL